MDELMVVVGGIGVLGSSVVQLYVYIYTCNEWTDVTPLMTCKLSMITCTDVRRQSDDSNVNVSQEFIQRRVVMKHLYCAVCTRW